MRTDNLAVAHHRALDDRVRPDDGDFRMVDDGRRHHAAKRAEACDRDRGTRKVVAGCFAVARQLSHTSDLARQIPDIARFGVAHDRNDQSVCRLRGDADMDGGEAMHDAGLVVEARVDLRIGRQYPHQCADQERQHGQLWLFGCAWFAFRCARRSSSSVMSISST